ncbi:anthranilate synthase component I family protein [Haliscomenobacter sp.]|uniref:anthranilate synthase component I family protein n=1 Tax=Haliscomenobacter sp. TaxID=2717303 RepID=UPI003364E2A2
MLDLSVPNFQVFSISTPDDSALEAFKTKAIHWLQDFEQFCCLDSNAQQQDPYHQYDLMLGAGCLDALICRAGEEAIQQLTHFQNQNSGAFLFGYLGYDLKNEVEQLSSGHPDPLGFPDLCFFIPEHRIEIRQHTIRIASATRSPQSIYQEIQNLVVKPKGKKLDVALQPRISRETYLSTVQAIRKEISLGNIYEMNFCQEFYNPAAALDPFEVYLLLREATQAPFGAFFRWHDHFALCASPERFLAKRGPKLISQPIKGTIRRGNDPLEDLALRNELFQSPKNRAENVMIVDLVRNDLARSCQPGTVVVEELFGIYGFRTVFQMISTVSGILQDNISAIQAIQYAFPMGSMTGAPKIRSMQLIEKLEQCRRGLYSGAIGYFAPNGDFDFNVVIRSLLYNQASSYLSLQVGGAIVFDSDPEAEYAECLLKAERIMGVLSGEDEMGE